MKPLDRNLNILIHIVSYCNQIEQTEEHSSIPWRQIKAMRNIVAHSYGTVDSETTWEIIVDDIPRLSQYCTLIIDELKSEE